MDENKAFRRVNFAPNQLIFDEGEKSAEAYLIRSGKVEIRVGVRSDVPRVLAVIGKGQVFGEMALFDNRPRVAAAVAVEPTEATAIARDEFQQRVADMDPAIRGVVLLMVERMRNMVEEVAGTRRSGRLQRIQEVEDVPETED
jgi:CRP-like cAMP-binding protein